MVSGHAWERIERHGARGRTATLKVRFSDFRTITRARSSTAGYTDYAAFLGAGRDLLRLLFPLTHGIRLLGLTLSGITDGEDGPAAVQPELPL